MPAAVAKGIIISLSIIAALSIAVLESPQVQSWLQEQRNKITELLRSVGEDLDPESRRRAEAFAYEGRTVQNDESPRQEAPQSLDTVAKATGRSLSGASTIRRIPVTGPKDSNEAEERRRKGREYLAKRNQQMIEMKERRKASKAEATASPTTPTTPTSFDAMVDSNGNLRDTPLEEKKLPSPPIFQRLPERVTEEMKEVERQLEQPIMMSEPSVAGQHAGTEAANPFGDEYALDRSITPRPAQSTRETQQSLLDQETNAAGLTYEEQLAIAMSLSEQESVANAATVRQRTAKEDADFRRAIRASLKDLDGQQAAHAVAHAESIAQEPQPQPLVDLSPSMPLAPVPRRHGWNAFVQPSFMPMQGQAIPRAPPSETTDELYSVTPELTRARLASFDAQQNMSASGSMVRSNPFWQHQEAAVESEPVQDLAEASFLTAASNVSPPPTSHTLDNESPQLIDFEEDMVPEGAQTPTSRTISPSGFSTDFGSETADHAPIPMTRVESQAQSEVSNVEVVNLEDDSDVDMLSEEGDGIATPDSWSEVGSREAESEAEDNAQPLQSSS